MMGTHLEKHFQESSLGSRWSPEEQSAAIERLQRKFHNQRYSDSLATRRYEPERPRLMSFVHKTHVTVNAYDCQIGRQDEMFAQVRASRQSVRKALKSRGTESDAATRSELGETCTGSSNFAVSGGSRA